MGITPQASASCLNAFSNGVAAIIGVDGLKREIILALLPLIVIATIAAAPKSLAALHVASLIAFDILTSRLLKLPILSQ